MDSKISISGSIAASVGSAAAWFCCLPFGLGALGAGGALASTLGPLRPYLIGLSIVLWVLALYALYRPERSCPEGRCASRRSLRRRRITLWVAALITLGMITVPYWGHWVIYWAL
ncbi:MAG TPA: mercuric transporter MerT family protein [Acidobacteriota bacterium]|nr:mercuric transporter MerT family protein [Acidobacteriota bacterium]